MALTSLRQHGAGPVAQLQCLAGARLRLTAPFVAPRTACRRHLERTARPGQVCAVYVAEQEVLTRTDSTAAAWAGPTARVTFRVKRQLPFGQLLKLVGGHHALGEWEVADAPAMTWSEGDVWQLVLDLPAGEHEFKVAAVALAGEVEKVVEWEAGPNRLLQVPAAEARVGGAFSLALEWGNPSASWDEDQDDAALSGASASASAAQLNWTIEDERAARVAAEAERDSLAVQLRHVRQQLEAALAEKAQLEAAAQRAQHNIDVLRQVGQLLRTMHAD